MKDKMSHNACTVNCGSRGTVLIWLHSSEVCGQVFFYYSAEFAGSYLESGDFKSSVLCFSAIRQFVSFLGGVFVLDNGYDSVTDYLNDLWSDVVFKQEVA